jgi:hypothetical protein
MHHIDLAVRPARWTERLQAAHGIHQGADISKVAGEQRSKQIRRPSLALSEMCWSNCERTALVEKFSGWKVS